MAHTVLTHCYVKSILFACVVPGTVIIPRGATNVTFYLKYCLLQSQQLVLPSSYGSCEDEHEAGEHTEMTKTLGNAFSLIASAEI